jgi:L-asparaginase
VPKIDTTSRQKALRPKESKRRLPNISIYALGGTIVSTSQRGKSGALIGLSAEELVAGIAEVEAIGRVRVHTFRQVPSGDLTMSDLLELVGAIRRDIDEGAQGIVVTQGTDTLEEVAFALDLLLDSRVPVVVTGAMRNASLPGSDGPANLLAAIQVAASPDAGKLGALVVFNDEIHAARFVRKRHSTSTATFGSPLTGPIGYVVEGRVQILLRLPGRILVELPAAPPEVKVALIPIVFDDDGSTLSKAATAPYQGVVVAAFGAGHVPARIAPLLQKLNERIPVVVASRTLAGDMLRSTYAYPGGEMDLLGRDLIFAGAYDAVHARLMLQLLLIAGAGRETISRTFQAGLTVKGRFVVAAG